MNKLTAEQISAEMDKFESLNPLPKYTSRCGNGYAVSEFNAWDGHAYCHKWEGWIARAAVALPILEGQERGDGEWIDWAGGECPVPEGVKAEIKFRDGDCAELDTWLDILEWRHKGYGSDIIAYRIIPERATNQNGEQ